MLWGLSAFFVGEERVTNQFSGLVMAAEDKHEEAFLLTQQVDEARHAQHFNRLYEEVFAYRRLLRGSPGAGARGPQRRLLHAVRRPPRRAPTRRCWKIPQSLEAKVDFITALPHGDRGHAGPHRPALPDRAARARAASLPGHLEAFKRIAQDEHRHVAYGTWFLQHKARDPELAKRVQDKLAETLPAAAGVLVPPGYKLGDEYEYLGYTSQEMNEFAFTALSRRLKVIGIGLPAAA